MSDSDFAADADKKSETLLTIAKKVVMLKDHAKALGSHRKLKMIVLSHSDLLTLSDSANKLDVIKQYL